LENSDILRLGKEIYLAKFKRRKAWLRASPFMGRLPDLLLKRPGRPKKKKVLQWITRM